MTTNRSNIHYVTGDATEPIGEGKKIIAHICNDQGGWGAGFVLALSNKWKEPEEHYREAFAKGEIKMGTVQVVKTATPNIDVVNMVAQHSYKTKDNPLPLSYETLQVCLSKLRYVATYLHATVHMPRIGCGLAGGDWKMVEQMIQTEICNKGIPVYVYDFEVN